MREVDAKVQDLMGKLTPYLERVNFGITTSRGGVILSSLSEEANKRITALIEALGGSMRRGDYQVSRLGGKTLVAMKATDHLMFALEGQDRENIMILYAQRIFQETSREFEELDNALMEFASMEAPPEETEEEIEARKAEIPPFVMGPKANPWYGAYFVLSKLYKLMRGEK